ncbi:reverse transcriptase domain-containing protein [Tanacetum coccineum]
MADQRIMEKLLQAPTEGYGDAIVIPAILAENYELKHGLLNLVTSKPFYGFEKEDPHAHIRWFNKITSTIKYRDVPNSSIKLMLFPFSIEGAARIWLEKEPPRSILTWEDLFSKFINQFFPPSKTTNLRNEITNFQQHSLNATAGGNLLTKTPRNALTNIEKKSKVRNSRNKPVATKALVLQRSPPPAFVKVVEEICVTCGGLHPYYQCLATDGNIFPEYRDNIQGYVTNGTEWRGHEDGKAVIIQTLLLAFVAICKNRGVTPSVPMPPPFINLEEDERAEETLTDPDLAEYTIKYQKMIKSLLSNKEKLLELANTPLNENCSVVILKKLPEKLGDPGKFLIPCSFRELNCKALVDLAGIASDVFVPVGRFTFPTDFVIVDYESDPRVPLILGRPFLRTARALIDVHGEELILRDGDEILILNMKHDTSRYSNKPQRESINMIDIYNISYEDYLEDLFANEKITNHLSGNPTFSSEPDTLTSDLTSPEVKDDIFDPEGDIVLIEKLLNFDSTKDLPPSHNINPLSGSTTSSSPSLTTSEISDYSLEEFADELALIESFPPRNDDMTSKDVLREIEYFLNRDPLYSPNNDHIYTIPEMFTDEHTLDYSSHPRYDDADDDLFDLKTDNDEWGKILYDDPFDSKENKIKDSKLLIDELDSPGSSSFLPHFLESDSVLYEDFSEVDTLTSTDNEDKVFNPGILVHENLYEVTNRVTPDKNVKKISSSNASLILEDYNPPLSDHELPFHIEIPRIALDFEASRACGFVLHSLELQSFA